MSDRIRVAQEKPSKIGTPTSSGYEEPGLFRRQRIPVMLVFVDESGDPGMDIEHGASAVFVVTAVIFEEEEKAQKCDRQVIFIREALGLPAEVEFKFTKSSNKVRKRFLETISSCEFFYLSLVIDKKKLLPSTLPNKETFYQYAVGLAFEIFKPYFKDALVDIDRTGGQDFGKRLVRYLSRRRSSREGRAMLKRVRTADSASSNLLQLADMVCGAVARSFGNKPMKDDFQQLIRHRELDLQVRP